MAMQSDSASLWMRVLGLLLLVQTSMAGPAISYCSPDLTSGSFQAVWDMYQTNGACQDTCQGSYAYAVLQGQNCWCSNYAPADQVSTYSCNTVCPGFGSEWCGNESEGLYGYFQLSGVAPSGTAGASSSSPSSTSVKSSSSSSPSKTVTAAATPTEIYTSITTVTGQVKTILVTPTPSSDSTLGSGTVVNSTGGGVSTGKVVGIVLGVALGLGLLVGLGVWFCVRKKHQRKMEAVAYETASSQGNTGIPSRQVSQMSSAGLLNKAPRIQTTGFPPSKNPRSADTLGSNFDRRSVGTDQRLNPYAIYAHEESRHSNVSLQDNQDYSRQLRVANPDP